MTRKEFEENWRHLETPEFVGWFTEIFGYDCSRPDEAEYWNQRVYAFMGWKGSRKFYSEDSYTQALSDVEAAIDELKQR